MKVILAASGYAPDVGGVETHVTEVARRLAEHCDIEVIAQRLGDERPPVDVVDGVTVRRFAVPVRSTNYAVAPGMWRYLSRHALDADIVHGHNYHALPALSAALSARRGRFVFTPHYHGVGHSRVRNLLHRLYRPLGALMVRRAAAVICVSRAEADLLRSEFAPADSRVRVIPNGVDASAFSSATPFPKSGPVLLSAGRLESYKRVDRMLEVLRHLPEQWTLTILGDGPARPDLELAAMALGVCHRVRFAGRVPAEDVRRWYRTADVCATFSEHEAFGITVLEGLAAGATVIASDIPAHRELRERHAQIKLVSHAASSAELATLIARSAGRGKTSPAGETWSWDEVADETLDLYRCVAGEA